MVWAGIWYSKKNNTGNYFPTINTNTNTTSSTSSSYGITSPRKGGEWVIGKNYPVSLKEGILSDYHPLMQVYALLDANGKGLGVICPDYEMQKGARTFEWKAGTLMTACSGTGNSEIEMSQGEYQILFTEYDANGDKIRTEKSGVFNLY